jgi:hypothetical protein
MAEVLGLAGTTPVPAFSVSKSMPKVDVVAVTVKLMAEVAPAAEAVTVTVPAVPPFTVTTSWPLEFVVPEVGVSVTVPVPDWVSDTAVPEIGFPPLSLAVMVKVTGDAPPAGTDVPVACNATVEPTTCTGSVAVAEPDVAVMVAVRFAWFAKPSPEEKDAVALPVASVVRVELLSCPELVLKVIVAPDTDALPASVAFTVIVVALESSVKTVEGVADI